MTTDDANRRTVTMCPICGTRLNFSPSETLDDIQCTNCGALVNESFSLDSYELCDIPHDNPVATAQIEQIKKTDDDRIKADPLPPPPKFAFLNGVFSFPFYRSTIAHCLTVAIGLIVVGTFAMMATQHAIEFVRNREAMEGVFASCLYFLTGLTGIFIISYSISTLLSVLHDTSHGYDWIEHWPEPDWRDWIWTSRFAYFSLFFSFIFGYAFNALTVVNSTTPALFSLFFLFPVFLLSSMESNSAVTPLSRPILRTLLSLWWGWLLFYACSAILCATCWAVISENIQRRPIATVLVSAPVISFSLFLYARLLGRLAWRASQVEAVSLGTTSARFEIEPSS